MNTGFRKYNRIFLMFIKFPSTRGLVIELIWRKRSCRVVIGIGFIDLVLVELLGVDIIFVWYPHTWLRGYHGQVSILGLTTFMTATTNLCTLFPCSFSFPMGFVWQGFLMRQNRWMTTYLVFILHHDCTRGCDAVWKVSFGYCWSLLGLFEDFWVI